MGVDLVPSQGIQKYLRRVLVVLAMIIILQGLTQVFTPSVARAYSCGNTLYGHCYGRQDWPGGPINGTEFTVSIGHMKNGDGFVDNETWLADCDVYAFPYCFNVQVNFVETGYIAVPNGTEQYFWADLRPQDSNVNEHLLGNVPSYDYGYNTYFEIHRYSSNSFELIYTGQYDGGANYSMNNSMVPDDILLGQELAGSSNAYAPRAYFNNNRWIDTSNNHHYQTALGSLHYDNPPYVGWTTDPKHSSTGGTLWTACC